MQLLYVLGCRTTCASLEKDSTSQQGNDGQHLGGGAELKDGEEIGEVVSQNISSHRDCVKTGTGPGARCSASISRGHELDVQSGGVVLLQVGLGQADQVGVVGTGGVEPENGLGILGASSVHAQLDPVLDGGVLGLAHPVDVAGVDSVAEDGGASGISDDHGALGSNLKGLVVASILLSLLSHKANIGDMSSGCPVKLSMLLAILDDRVVHGRIGSVRDDTLHLLQLVSLVPHLTTITDYIGH